MTTKIEHPDQTSTVTGATAWLVKLGPYATIVLTISTMILIWAGAIYLVSNERQQVSEGKLQTATNLARAFQEQITSMIHNVDLTLFYVRAELARDPEKLDVSLLERNSLFLDGVTLQVALIDKNGIMTYSNIPGSKPGVDLSDREHFRVHQNSDKDDLFISKPVAGRVSGKWSIQFTRKINKPGEPFAGVIVVSVDPYYLSQFYRSIDIGKQGAIALIGDDGIVRARATDGASALGESVSAGPLLDEARKGPQGHYTSISKIDNVERLFVFRKVPNQPLIVTVGLGTAEMWADFYKEIYWIFTISGLISIWLIILSVITLLYQRDLYHAIHEASAGLRSRSQFLAVISHEMRTPLNGIIGMAELVAMSTLTATQKMYVETLHKSAMHLLTLINNVLDFSKLEADRIVLEVEPVNVHDMIADCMDIVRPAIAGKPVDLVCKIESQVPRVIEGDKARLRQVILNILGNAVKFTETGKVTITCSMLQWRDVADPVVRIMIEDTGIGIPQAALSKLFREFSQVDGSISRKFGGTGLGLAICKRLVTAMGGVIEVSSKFGSGTAVNIEFPVKVIDESAATTVVGLKEISTKAEVAPSERISILLVEDDPTNQMVATRLLESLGHSVCAASSGAQALDYWAGQKFDLIFMDMMMPVMDGLETTRTLRITEKAKGLEPSYIVALTANTRDEDKQACLESGMDSFVVKPVTRAGLQQAIAQYFRHREATESTEQAPQTANFHASNDRMAELIEEFGEEMAHEVADIFITSMDARLEELRAAFAAMSRDQIKNLSHAAKGSCGTIGVSDCAKLFEQLERSAVDAEEAELATLFAKAQRAYAQAKLSMSPMLKAA